jgi:hypothetical protein
MTSSDSAQHQTLSSRGISVLVLNSCEQECDGGANLFSVRIANVVPCKDALLRCLTSV